MAVAVRSEEHSFAQRIRDGREEIAELRDEAGEIAGGIGRIARAEAHLAVSEVRDGVRATIRAGFSGAVAMALGVVTLLWLPLPVVIGLAEVMPWWSAALITVGVLVVITAIAGFVAVRHFKSISLVPHGAIERMKEDKQWVTQQLSRKQS